MQTDLEGGEATMNFPYCTSLYYLITFPKKVQNANIAFVGLESDCKSCINFKQLDLLRLKNKNFLVAHLRKRINMQQKISKR